MVKLRNIPILWFVVALAAVGLLALAALPASTQAGPGLPGRDTPTPTRSHSTNKHNDGPAGAYIELHVAGAPAGAWAAVQWADQAGAWHDVEGWRGTLDRSGVCRWWVHPTNFGSGPFRWVVYGGPGGPVTGASAAFRLPAAADELVAIQVPAAQ